MCVEDRNGSSAADSLISRVTIDGVTVHGGSTSHDDTNPFGATVYSARDVILRDIDRKSTRLNSSHPSISYAVFCLKKKNTIKFNRLTIILLTLPAVKSQNIQIFYCLVLLSLLSLYNLVSKLFYKTSFQ